MSKKELQQKIVDIARSWKGTKWVHQGRLKGKGVDCAGFIVGTAHEFRVGVEDTELIRTLASELNIPNDYNRRENGEELIRLLEEHMVLVDDIQKGDVLALVDPACRERDVPRHLAIVTENQDGRMTIIHASEAGIREHRMNTLWKNRIHSAYRLKELMDE